MFLLLSPPLLAAVLPVSTKNQQDVPKFLLITPATFASAPSVNLQVSALYKSTAFKFVSRNHDFVLVLSEVDLHIGGHHGIANPYLAFPIRAWMSFSVSLFLLKLLPRYN